jgi:hypothetical protein
MNSKAISVTIKSRTSKIESHSIARINMDKARLTILGRHRLHMNDNIHILKGQAINSRNIGFDGTMTLHRAGAGCPFDLPAAASEIRDRFKGKCVNLCIGLEPDPE